MCVCHILKSYCNLHPCLVYYSDDFAHCLEAFEKHLIDTDFYDELGFGHCPRDKDTCEAFPGFKADESNNAKAVQQQTRAKRKATKNCPSGNQARCSCVREKRVASKDSGTDFNMRGAVLSCRSSAVVTVDGTNASIRNAINPLLGQTNTPASPIPQSTG